MLIGIGGVSRSGKSTLARMLVNYFRDSGKTAIVLYQDDFVFPTTQIPMVRDKVDWEHPGSINHDLLWETTGFYRERFEVVIIDGFLAFHDSRLRERYDKRIFVRVSRETFLERKENDLRWGDIPRWFFDHIWESYLLYGIPDFAKHEYLQISGETMYDLEKILPQITME
ncbi:MAG: AAA family ATPase [Leadbetterella sp.]|nr:AAA family ATPase [Leadbetterella sp.]